MTFRETFFRLLNGVNRRLFKKEVLAWRALPANFHSQDTSPQALQKDAEYAYQVGHGYLTRLIEAGLSLNGLRGVEFGPGCNFGTALYLVCRGIKMTVADRFLSPWKNNYHPDFYRAFLRFLKNKEPQLPLKPIQRVLDAEGYPEDVLTLHNGSLEDMGTFLPGIFDVTFSNAVIEHLYDPERALAQLSRLTAKGGMGFHQVDHRDHRDFSRPLEYLLLPDAEFREVFRSCHGECGNRIRHWEMKGLFEKHGFEVVNCDQNMMVSPDYLEDFFFRLQHAQETSFCGLSREDLACISCQYVIRKAR